MRKIGLQSGQFSRRELLRAGLASGLLAGQCLPHGSPFSMMRSARAQLPAPAHPVAVQFMMLGGPDFRHVFAPPYETAEGSFGREFYRVRAPAYRIDDSAAAAEAFWQQGFYSVQANGTEFGIKRGLEWLKMMWDAGHVAIVNNVVGAESRNHDHAQIVWESADRGLTQLDSASSGWGGRLADHTDSLIYSLTPSPRPFCFHSNPDNPAIAGSRRVVSLTNPDAFGLFKPDADLPSDDLQVGITRALQHYYAAARESVLEASPYSVFFEHEQSLRALGDSVRSRFENLEIPAPVAALGQPGGPLNDPQLGQSFVNLYHALASADILDFRSVSMAYGSFDSHDRQQEEIEPKFEDLFGANATLANLYQSLPELVSEKLVFVFSGEFGRQLKANGGLGTDHGRGNSVVLVGLPVTGGVYGEMFPAAELDHLDRPSPDIEGRTHIEALLAQITDWLAPGSSSQVFPSLTDTVIEPGVSFANLLQA